jgi:hypothetical protein
VTGNPDHSSAERKNVPSVDEFFVEQLSDDELESELTIAAYAPGRLRWERYQRLLLERLRRHPIAS